MLGAVEVEDNRSAWPDRKKDSAVRSDALLQYISNVEAKQTEQSASRKARIERRRALPVVLEIAVDNTDAAQNQRTRLRCFTRWNGIVQQLSGARSVHTR
ncbi:hypothetical protein PHSY_002501 [Pseudozyma hubeiensis SY62]|uniref:Uncharacterized protein n=1 Tax=Pseudozyma hubeiensis (strain SY62) TaxID=1305764 RepID=R9P100_PSEHS|nr:hypothetical protein PHSY_002501 [Pseudozyma hubeiensis SY62]GAC94928.1 hypothetical protein PHSY_002501 [Pseudozyma hubeiensis SY62]